MIELINTAVQTVAAGQSVVYNATPVKGGCAERHRSGSAQLVLLKPGRYLVVFSGNVAVPEGGTPGEISFALTYDGEALSGSTMRVTPTAAEAFFNISTQHYVDVFCNCCVTVTVENTGAEAALVDNPNLTAVRVC